MRGTFIVIEGLDGSGGTTQCRLLAKWSKPKGQPVIQTAEPTDLPVGVFIRKALKQDTDEGRLGDSVLPHLFAADRQDHLDRRVNPALERGEVEKSDRKLHSSPAYQRWAVGFDTVATLNANFRIPDLTLFLDLDQATCLERVVSRGGALERFETQERLSAIADAYAQVEQWCLKRGERFVRVDASGTIQDIHERIQREVHALWSGQ